MKSLQYHLALWLIKATGIQKRIANARMHAVTGSNLIDDAPSSMLKQKQLERYGSNSHPIFTFTPNLDLEGKHIIFLHGGGFINGITNLHWDFCKALANYNFCKVSILDYPLPPLHNYEESLEYVIESIQTIIEKNGHNLDYSLMGDSAGGTLVLSGYQYLSTDYQKKIDNLVLISPWVDLGLQNPLIDSYTSKDPILDRQGLIDAAKLFCRDLPLDSPKASPINENYSELPRVCIFNGRNDIFYPDIKCFYEKIQSTCSEIEYYEEDLFHIYPLVPIPESKTAHHQIYSFLMGGRS